MYEDYKDFLSSKESLDWEAWKQEEESSEDDESEEQ